MNDATKSPAEQRREELQHQSIMNALVEREEYNLFALLRPTVTKDGSQWCCLYGNNLQEGVAGFGETPHKAVMAWNREWYHG